MKAKPATTIFLLAAQAMLLGGCATSALWEDGRFARYHEPALPLNVRLYFSPEQKDFLVLYDEWREDSDVIRHRAFWLAANQARLAKRTKPHFVSDHQPRPLTPVPVFQELPADLSEIPPIYAIISTNSYALTLYSERADRVPASLVSPSVVEQHLPVYRDASGRIKQVLLTPFAVTADATIVSGVIFYWALPGSAAALVSHFH